MSEQESTTATPAPEAAATPTTATEAPAEAVETPTADEFDASRALDKIRKANAEAKALRERAKVAEDKATSLEDVAKRVPDLEAQLVRERVARRLSLPDELVDRLRGATEDEVMADAEKLVALVAPKQRPAAAAARPVESLQPGSGVAASGPAQLSRADMAGMTADQIVAAKAAGQFDTLLGIKTA